ncbi:DNA/RNA polymerases superfamily protein [Gossypium australe]|uniref:DNA/RNA polymerases superfamily protein n=1 Tax=Gossypium australe TaxID=47621 RepID=A0A5B6W7P5_9ROSI|nr:DNA/RNA polymerases superfamily protein [Gossypium australe]
MMFKLAIVPTIFMNLMNSLPTLYGPFFLLSLSMILVYSKSVVDHEKHLEIVLRTFKCEFWLRKAHFLGHVISAKGIIVDLDKIKAMLDWNLEKNVTEVHSFLVLAGFSMLETPLTHLLRKKEIFEWIVACQKSFDKLKAVLMEAPNLAQQ